MSNQINIVLPKQIDQKLEKAKEETGLTKSEIGRRGIINEIQKLQVNNQEK